MARFFLAFYRQHARELRHKRRVERALGKKPAQEIGQLESDKKRIGQETRAQAGGDGHIAQEAQQAGDQRVAADGGGGFDEGHGGSC